MDKMTIGPRGLKYLIVGFVVMVAGYVLMMGGLSPDPQVFNYDMFDFRKMVVAPVVILAGIVIDIIAIMADLDSKKGK